MRRTISLTALAALLTLLLVGCDCRRPIIEDSGLWTRVTVDWTKMGIKPNGTSIWFFPDNSDNSPQVLRMQTLTDSLMLRKGTYSVIVFNETESDHDYILFRGGNSYETFEAYAKDITVASKYMVRAATERIAATPDQLGVATMTGLEITREMINKDLRPSLLFEPKRTFATVNVLIHVVGLDNASSSGGSAASLSGMADGVILYNGVTNSTPVTHIFNINNIRFNSGSYQDGTMSSSFMVFGLTDMPTRADDVPNYLTLFFHLRNGEDLDPIQIDVSRTLEVVTDESGRVTINIEVGQDGSIILPYVESSTDKGSGFDADVTDWGEENNYDIPI